MGENCQVNVDGYLDWPNCQIHYELTTTSGDFYSWVWESMGDPHGPIHLWLGGVLDCASTYNSVSTLVGPDVAATLAFLAVEHRRSAFCNGVWSCEGDKVSVDVKPEEVRNRKGGVRERRRGLRVSLKVAVGAVSGFCVHPLPAVWAALFAF